MPAWYDKLAEKDRWDVQARFWEAVAGRCADSPAVFCYDLMNEPVVPGGKRKDGDWLGPAFGGKHFVQFITLDQAGPRRGPTSPGRGSSTWPPPIRKDDQRHLDHGRPGGLEPGPEGADLRLRARRRSPTTSTSCRVHLYPETGKVDEALKTLKGFAVGKPVVIEETFPLKCSPKELDEFIDGSRKHAAGWIGFYWGKPPEELRKSKEIADAILLAWLDLFREAEAVTTEDVVSRIVIVGFSLLAGFAVAAPADDKPKPVRVLIQTDTGDIEVELDAAKAPATVANFLRYVDGKFYDGGRFHRTVTPDNQPDNKVKIEVIQAGINPDKTKDEFAADQAGADARHRS